ncbi:unnamed protein product [Allacma fusca]|uniref:Uncharacterized protein n=1 Tax=Allacma fusca TaxID=39272 RepID=A0A8J2PB91_9HEXA|nr:unnamed protein product [Allacma fusca]
MSWEINQETYRIRLNYKANICRSCGKKGGVVKTNPILEYFCDVKCILDNETNKEVSITKEQSRVMEKIVLRNVGEELVVELKNKKGSSVNVKVQNFFVD